MAGILAMFLALSLGSVLARPRPFVALGLAPLLPHAATATFPSRHTLVGVALAGPVMGVRRRLGLGLVVWVLGVGLARVAAGLHYPSDILGSALLALGPMVLGWWMTRRLFQPRGERR